MNGLYNVVDRIFIGNIPGVGPLAITGLGVTMPIMTIIMAFGMLIGIGTTTNISIKLGQGKKEEAEKLISSLKESEKEVAKIKGDTDATVAILFGSGENFMLATETSYLGDLLKTVGGTNIATELDGSAKSPYLQFSLEQIVQTNPDYILRFAHGNLEETKKAFDDAFDKNPAYAELDAVKNNKVIDLDSNVFNVSANLNET